MRYIAPEVKMYKYKSMQVKLNRILNRDGSDNINRQKIKRNVSDLYHSLMSSRWSTLFAITLLSYFSINFVFGLLYFILGPEGLSGLEYKSGWMFFEECYFFSVQTFSTIGYGRISPVGIIHNILVAIEAFTGMLSIAVMSGLLFTKFSRPISKVKFSEVALITKHRGHRCLLFRMANARLNQIVEASVSVSILMSTITPEGQSLRIQHELPLIRNKSLFFSLSWMVAHIIDDKSPLFGKTLEELQSLDAEIIISVLGYDETYGQTIHARYSYIASEIQIDRQFVDMINRIDGKLNISLENISKTT